MEKQLGGSYDHATDRPAVRTLVGLGHSADGVRLVDLVRPSSNRAQIPAGAGLYAIYETGGAEEPVYIGQSTNLRSRIGRLLGGALTGAEGHIAGWRIGNGDKNTGDAPVRVEVIEIHWWPDLDLHGARRAPAPSAQEAALIKRHNPQLNTQHRSQPKKGRAKPKAGGPA